MADLSAKLAGLTLAFPTLTCAGTSGYGPELADLTDFSRLGAFVTKSVTREERPGNAPARAVETPAGMLNAIGLANIGLARFLAEKVPLLQAMPCPVVVNVAGHCTADYIETVAALSDVPAVAAVELNVSCPNVADGLTFAADPSRLRELVKRVKRELPSKPLIVKLSPNVAEITETAAAAVDGGADVLSLVNTFTAMAIDVNTRRPRLANGTGGLSGPAIRPIAVYLVSRVYRAVAKPAGVPLIGMGGVQSWRDAAEFVLAGASAVAVGTAMFVDPTTPGRIADGLSRWADEQGAARVGEMVGTLIKSE